MSELVTTGLFTKKIRCFDAWERLDFCKKNNHYPLEQCKEENKEYLDCTYRKKEVMILLF